MSKVFRSSLSSPEELRRRFERLTDCQGETRGAGGFEMVDTYSRRYRNVDDVHLRRIAERYGATHEVLYRETPSAFPTLAKDAWYRIRRWSHDAIGIVASSAPRLSNSGEFRRNAERSGEIC